MFWACAAPPLQEQLKAQTVAKTSRQRASVGSPKSFDESFMSPSPLSPPGLS
jgi:hypothetical protein